jgi:predicted nucleic acid-binding protein
MVGAWEVWDQLWADDRIAMLPEPDGLEPRLRLHSRLGSASPKVWADAYLVAFASTAGLKLVTFDRALESGPVEVLVL